MGNFFSYTIDNEKLCTDITNNNLNVNYKYKYHCSVLSSNIKNVIFKEEYTLYLCENDLILQNDNKEHIFIYNNILYWKSTNKNFEITYKDIDKYISICLSVEDGNKIADQLKIITYNLVTYYNNL